jgi:pyruvate/2-oxoglutarate dehydrogenase complex dihydrolipoamide acyltransferase (E2) component
MTMTRMPVEILLPKIGFSMEEGTLAEWLVPDGTDVREGQPLYSLESEKSVQEIEAPASGRLKIIAIRGESYKVGTVLGEIE